MKRIWETKFCTEGSLSAILNALEREHWNIFAVNTVPETEATRFGHMIIAWKYA